MNQLLNINKGLLMPTPKKKSIEEKFKDLLNSEEAIKTVFSKNLSEFTIKEADFADLIYYSEKELKQNLCKHLSFVVNKMPDYFINDFIESISQQNDDKSKRRDIFSILAACIAALLTLQVLKIKE
jgi:ribosomal protein S24E